MSASYVTIQIKGWATFCKSEEENFLIGYFLSQENGMFKLLLKPSKNPPLFHDCCRPQQPINTENDHESKEKYYMIPNCAEHNHHKSDSAAYAGESSFFDLTLKQGDQTIRIENCQLGQPGSDVLNFSSTWSDEILGRHDNDTGALFLSHAVKIGKDADLVVDKHFPVFKGKDCVINAGELMIHYISSS